MGVPVAQNFQLPLQTVLDSDGDPLPGAKLYFYDAGTTDEQTVYSDSALSTAVTQPLVADSAGRVPLTYVSPGSYKVVITDADDNAVATYDNLDSGLAASSGDLAVADGGTGASTAAGARTNLGAASQTEVDSLSTDLTAIETAISNLPGSALGDMAGEDDVAVDNLATGFGVVCLQDSFVDTDTTNTDGSTYTFPFDDTLPQRTEGLEVLSGNFTPESASSKLEITVQVHIGGEDGNSTNFGAVALFTNDSLDAIAAGWWEAGSAAGKSGATTCTFVHVMDSPGTSAITFSARAGAYSSAAANAWYINGHETASGRVYGGALESFIRVRELLTV